MGQLTERSMVLGMLSEQEVAETVYDGHIAYIPCPGAWGWAPMMRSLLHPCKGSFALYRAQGFAALYAPVYVNYLIVRDILKLAQLSSTLSLWASYMELRPGPSLVAAQSA